MKQRYFLFLIFMTAACVPSEKVKDTTAGNINKNAPYIWDITSLSFPLSTSKAFTAEEKKNVTDMGDAWASAVGKTTLFTGYSDTDEVSSETLSLTSLGKGGIFGIYKLSVWPKELPGSALAVTQLFGRRHNIGEADEYVGIEHADILVNYDDYKFRTTDDDSVATFDLQTVLLHELGHFMGLQHKEGDTVMVPAIGPETVKRAPTAMDTADILQKYYPSSTTPQLLPKNLLKRPDQGQAVRIIMELRSDGECVHKENGAVIQRHHIKSLK